jgi:hypothetical protein
MELPKGLTIERVQEAAESADYIGFCMACGAEHEGVEPDARKCGCGVCGEKAVYGSEEILIEL